MQYVVVRDPGFQRCSEAETAESLIYQIERAHPEVDEVLVEDVLPATLPAVPYVLWDIFPRLRGARVDWRCDPHCQAAICVDIDDGVPGYDFYLVTADNTEPAHHVVEADLLAHGGSWPSEQRQPWAPYRHIDIHPASAEPEEPLYVMWNAEHHGVGAWQAAYSERVLPVLKELDVRRVIVTRSERSGRIGPLLDDPWFTVEHQEADLTDGAYASMLAQAFCCVVSVPSTHMLMIPRALAAGVPVYAYRSGRWREQYVSLPELKAYAECPDLRAHRRGYSGDDRLPDDDVLAVSGVPLGQVLFAEAMAMALRESRTKETTDMGSWTIGG